MSDHPRIRNLRSVGDVLETAVTSLSSNPVIFTLLCLLLFAFRSAIETRYYRAASSLVRDVYGQATVIRNGVPSPPSPACRELTGSGALEKYHDRAVGFVMKRLGLGRSEAEKLIPFITSAMFKLGFLLTYSCALGAVYVITVNDLTGRFDSVVRILWDGSRLGIRRLYITILWHCVVRDILPRLLGLWFFRRAKGFHALMLIMRLELVPFSGMLPWHAGYNREIWAFLSAWFLTDTVTGCAFAVETWIAIVEWGNPVGEIIKESYHLVSTSFVEAVKLRFLECVLSGIVFRDILSQSFGDVFAAIFQAAMEVYFKVVWLFFYLSFRCRDTNNSPGRSFELKELVEAFQGVR